MPTNNTARDRDNRTASDIEDVHCSDSTSQCPEEVSFISSSLASASSSIQTTPVRSNAPLSADVSNDEDSFIDRNHNSNDQNAAAAAAQEPENRGEKALDEPNESGRIHAAADGGHSEAGASSSGANTERTAFAEALANVLRPLETLATALAHEISVDDIQFRVQITDNESPSIENPSEDEYTVDDEEPECCPRNFGSVMNSNHDDEDEDEDEEDKDFPDPDRWEKTTELFRGAHILQKQVVTQLCCPYYQPQWFDYIDLVQEAAMQEEFGPALDDSDEPTPSLSYHHAKPEKYETLSWTKGSIRDAVYCLYGTNSLTVRNACKAVLWAREPGFVTDAVREAARDNRIRTEETRETEAETNSSRDTAQRAGRDNGNRNVREERDANERTPRHRGPGSPSDDELSTSSDEDSESDFDGLCEGCGIAVDRCVECQICCEPWDWDGEETEDPQWETSTDDAHETDESNETDWETCSSDNDENVNQTREMQLITQRRTLCQHNRRHWRDNPWLQMRTMLGRLRDLTVRINVSTSDSFAPNESGRVNESRRRSSNTNRGTSESASHCGENRNSVRAGSRPITNDTSEDHPQAGTSGEQDDNGNSRGTSESGTPNP